MTRKRILEILPIITAYANGEDIQYRLPGSTEDWKTWNEDKTVSPFNHDHWEFRIKPKPREFLITLSSNNTPMSAYDLADESTIRKHEISFIKVREVL